MSRQITLAAKINESEAAVFQHWCHQQGMSPNEVITYMIECVLKMLKGEPIKDERIFQVMRLWDSFRDISNVIRVLSPKAKLEVVETVYLISQKGKRGTFPVLVEPSFFDEPNYSTDGNEILQEVMSAVCKGLVRDLNAIKEELDSSGIIETIRALLTYYRSHEDPIHNEIEEMFSDNARHEYGRDTELIKYKRHNRQTVDQMKIYFDDEQGQELQETDTEFEMVDDGEDDEG